MIFFTRQLYDGYQPGSKWQNRAMKLWDRNGKIYKKYFKLISPLLPKSVIKANDISLHDCRVRSVVCDNDQISFTLDTASAVALSPHYTAVVSFKGVKNKVPVSKLNGAWWLYDEVHLSHSSRFAYHIFLDRIDLEVYADEFSIKFIRNKGAGKKHRTSQIQRTRR